MTNDGAATLIGAFAGVLTYWGQTGFAIPKNGQETAGLIGSLAIVGLGYLTNKTGRAPWGEQRVTVKEPQPGATTSEAATVAGTMPQWPVR
jgi:hypothetical protein